MSVAVTHVKMTELVQSMVMALPVIVSLATQVTFVRQVRHEIKLQRLSYNFVFD